MADLEHELVVNEFLSEFGANVIRNDEPEKEFVDDLNVGPGAIQLRLLLLRLQQRSAPVLRWRQRPKDIRRHHIHHVLQNLLRETVPSAVHIPAASHVQPPAAAAELAAPPRDTAAAPRTSVQANNNRRTEPTKPNQNTATAAAAPPEAKA